MEPLFIFLDLEAAHGDNYFGDIIELAAQVDPRMLRNEIFNRLINTHQTLSYFALHVSRIKKSDLCGKQFFPEVFEEFSVWVSRMLLMCKERRNRNCYPVLVAHGGFSSDFLMLQSNLERNEVSCDVLNRFHFADTHIFAEKLKERNVEGLGCCHLSIEKLFKKFFPTEKMIGQHRALPDVKFMIKIFLKSKLKKYFREIPTATFEERNANYQRNNTTKEEKQTLEDNLPDGMAKVTHSMTLTRLLRNGLTHARLQALFESSESTLDFYDRLKQVGIERKAAKSMASRLVSSGLMCRGGIEKDSKLNDSDSQKDGKDSKLNDSDSQKDGKDSKLNDSDSQKDGKDSKLNDSDSQKDGKDSKLNDSDSQKDGKDSKLNDSDSQKDGKDSKLNDSDSQKDGKDSKLNDSDSQKDVKVVGSDCEKDGKVFDCDLQKDAAKDASSCQLEGKDHTESGKVICKRSDSGYSSVTSVDREYEQDIDWDKFYDMFVDEFFWPPEVYVYTFGSFTIEEIQALDIYIDALFASRFGETLFENMLEQDEAELSFFTSANSTVDKTVCKHDCIENDNEVSSLNTKIAHVVGDNKSTNDISQGEENWEEEFCAETFTMPKLVRVVPIGMTMDSFNGEILSERVPLYHHFDEFDVSSVPVGVFSKPPPRGGNGKKGKSKQKKNKGKGKSEASSVLIEETAGRAVLRSSDGEVFVLV